MHEPNWRTMSVEDIREHFRRAERDWFLFMLAACILIVAMFSCADAVGLTDGPVCVQQKFNVANEADTLPGTITTCVYPGEPVWLPHELGEPDE